MRISKLHLAISSDEIRPQIRQLFVTKTETAVTDGHLLLTFHSDKIFKQEFLDSIPDDGLLIPDAFVSKLTENNIKSLRYYPEKNEISIPYEDCFLFAPVKINGTDLKFPSYNDLFDAKPEKIDKIGISTSKLDTICQIFPDQGLKFSFRGMTTGIEITVIRDEPAFIKGLLMPYMLSDEL